jgi:methanethiol oxidase
MTMRPDPTFHASPKLAMEAPPENFAYTLLLSPDFSKPDALAVIDVKRGSPTFSQIVHTVTMPYTGDEFHHFGWNACSSALSPLTGHAFLERRYLIIPGLRSSDGDDPARAGVQGPAATRPTGVWRSGAAGDRHRPFHG